MYINDVNLFGRTWQVQAQAEAADRKSLDDIGRINVRNKTARWSRCAASSRRSVVIGPQALIRYNNRLAVTVQGSPAPGVSSGQALAAMEAVAAKALPPGYQGEWTDISFQEKRAEGKTAIILAFADPVRLSVPRRPLRKLDHPRAGAALGHRSAFWAPSSDRRGGSDARSLRADRHGRADRPRRQERHSDRRIRQGAARAWHAAAGSRDRRRAAAVPAGDDDLFRLHPRPRAAGVRHGRRDAGAPQRRRRRCSAA